MFEQLELRPFAAERMWLNFTMQIPFGHVLNRASGKNSAQPLCPLRQFLSCLIPIRSFARHPRLAARHFQHDDVVVLVALHEFSGVLLVDVHLTMVEKVGGLFVFCRHKSQKLPIPFAQLQQDIRPFEKTVAHTESVKIDSSP